MNNGVDPGTLLVLGAFISGIIIVINGAVEMFGERIRKKWPRTEKWPKGWVNFVTGVIVGMLAWLGLWFGIGI